MGSEELEVGNGLKDAVEEDTKIAMIAGPRGASGDVGFKKLLRLAAVGRVLFTYS